MPDDEMNSSGNFNNSILVLYKPFITIELRLELAITLDILLYILYASLYYQIW